MKVSDYISKFRGLYNYNEGLKVNIAYACSFPVAVMTNLISTNIYLDVVTLLLQIVLILLDLSTTIGRDADFKDIKKIRKIYDEVLKNYIKLNNNFEFKNPIELYTFYHHMFSDGYLSKGHTFVSENNNVYDIDSIYGVNILNGKGCCRHISSMFKDILNHLKIDNNLLLVTENWAKVEIFSLKEKIESLMLDTELAEIANDKDKLIEAKEKLIELLAKLEEQQGKLQEEDEYIKKVIDIGAANHMINVAYSNDKTYLLDPSGFRIYGSKNGDILYDEADDNILVNYKTKGLYEIMGENIALNLLKQRVSMSNISEEEKCKYIGSTLKIYNKNQDMLEKFYKENHEAYEEISDKLLKIKKK